MTKDRFAELVKASVPSQKAGLDWLEANVEDLVARRMWRHAVRIVWSTYKEIYKSLHEENDDATTGA